MSQVTELTALGCSAAKYFRLGMEAAGSEDLTRFIDDLFPLLGSLPAETISHLNEISMAVLGAQARRDFLQVADLLQYKIAPLLNG